MIEIETNFHLDLVKTILMGDGEEARSKIRPGSMSHTYSSNLWQYLVTFKYNLGQF